MSLPAQTLSTLITALALSLAIQLPRVSRDSTPRETGNSTIRGVVTYADTGRPVRYAGVRLRNDKTGNWIENIVTDRHGEFVVKGVPAGHYIVFVHSPGILEPSFSPGPSSLLARHRLSGEPLTEAIVNGTDSVDVKVQAVRGGVITGRVVTEDDQPVASADIKLLKRENGKWAPVAETWNRYSSDNQIKTDPSGVYRVAGLVAGEYVVRVSESDSASDELPAEDGAYAKGFFMAAYYPSATTVKDAQTVTVIEGSEATGVDIRMPERAAYTISGTLTFGPDDEPGAWADVLLERVDEVGYTEPNITATTRADEHGKWEVPGVPAGDYSVKFGGSVRVGISDQEGHVTVAPKRVSVRVEHDDVIVPEVRLSQGSTITGKVIWDGKPPKNYFQLRVQAVPARRLSRGVESEPQSERVNGTLTDSVGDDGNFWLTGVPAGRYSIRMWAFQEDRFYVQSITRKGVDLRPSPLKVGEGVDIKDVVITLSTNFASIEGRLTRPESSPKLNLQDAVVILAPANDATRRLNRGLIALQPDAQGNFAVNCAPGEYFLTAVTSAEIRKLAQPIDEEYFKKVDQKFERVKVKAGEKVKGLTVPVGVN